MNAESDFSCEIMGLIALTILSALSHFWYLLIAVGVIAALAGSGLLIALIFRRIGRELLARFVNPVCYENSKSEEPTPDYVAGSQGPSVPVS